MAAADSNDSHNDWHIQEIQTSEPWDNVCNIEPAPDGSLWFVEHSANRLGRLDLETGDIKKFDHPAKVAVPFVGNVAKYPAPFALGPCDINFADDGNLWFNHQAANQIGFIRPEPPYDFTTIDLPTPGSVPMSLDRGADNAVYVTLTGADKIARVDLATHEVTEFTVPTPASGIIGGYAGRDAHWFVEIRAGKLLRFDYETHEMREYRIPTPGAAPFVVRVYDGMVWFSEFGSNKIGRFNPQTEHFSEITLPGSGTTPVGLALGADGDLYVNQSVGVGMSELPGASRDQIVRIDRKTLNVVDVYPLPTSGLSFADEIKRGPDNAIYVTEFFAGNIARLWVESFGRDPGFPSG